MKDQKIFYKVVSTINKSWFDVQFDPIEIEKGLNQLGDEGWDLVNTLDINHATGKTKEILFILKKHKK